MKPQDRTRAILRSGLDPESKLVAIAIADYLSADDGVAWPSIGTLAGNTGLAVSTVRRRIHAAELVGWLSADRRPGRSGRYGVRWLELPATPVSVTPLPMGHPCQADTPTPVSVTPHPCHADTPTPVRLTPLPLSG
jgi:hypothetical protein